MLTETEFPPAPAVLLNEGVHVHQKRACKAAQAVRAKLQYDNYEYYEGRGYTSDAPVFYDLHDTDLILPLSCRNAVAGGLSPFKDEYGAEYDGTDGF